MRARQHLTSNTPLSVHPVHPIHPVHPPVNSNRGPLDEFEDLWERGEEEQRRGNLKEAIGIFSQAVEFASRAEDLSRELRGYTRVGLLHRLCGQYSESVTCHMRELEIAQQFQSAKLICAAHAHLGEAYFRHAQHLHNEMPGTEDEEKRGLSNALHHYELLIRLARALNDRMAVAKANRGLGLVSSARGKEDVAVEHFEKYLQTMKSIGSRAQQLEALRLLSDSLMLGLSSGTFGLGSTKKDFDRVLELLWDQAVIAEETSDTSALVRCYVQLGQLYEESGSYTQFYGPTKARQMYEKCIEIAKDVPLSKLGTLGAEYVQQAKDRLHQMDTSCIIS